MKYNNGTLTIDHKYLCTLAVRITQETTPIAGNLLKLRDLNSSASVILSYCLVIDAM